MPSKEELEKGFTLGDWEVIPSRRLLRRGGEEISPEPKPFQVLMSLALRGGDGVTRDELVDEVWDGRPAADEVINRCIAQLRGHFGDKRPYRYIETLQKSGYRLKEQIVLKQPDAPVAVLQAPPGKPPSIVFRGIVVLALMAMVVAIIWEYWGRPPPREGVSSVVVLPFENVSGNDENQYLVEGFKQELIKTLQPLPNVVIKTGRDTYPDLTPSQIANVMDADSVLLGKVNRFGDDLQVTYELIVGNDNSVLSGTKTGNINDIFEIQEQVAEMVRANLFGGAQQVLVSTSRPSNFDAYDSYLKATYTFDRRGNNQNLEAAMRLFEETIQLDPSFGPAYLHLATAYTLMPAYRGASLDDSNRMAISVVEQGIAADPTIKAAAGAVYGFIYHSQKEWAKSELAYQQATAAAVVDSNAFNWYSRMLASVGRLDEALVQARKAYTLDPDSAVIASRLAMSYSWLGDAKNAATYFDLAQRKGAEGTTHLMGWALFLAREGEIDRSREVAKIAANNAGFPPEWIDDVIAGMVDAEKQVAALQSVNQTVSAGYMPPQIEVVVRTLLGDLDGAMQVANLLERPGEAFEMDLLWIPEFRSLREHPDYIGLMERLGITEYWSLHGCEFVDALVVCSEA